GVDPLMSTASHSQTLADMISLARSIGSDTEALKQLEATHNEKVARLKAELTERSERLARVAQSMEGKSVAPSVAPTVATNGTAKAAAPKPVKKAVKAKTPVRGVIKFRNPDNANDKPWTGRGTQPAWYKAGLAAGKTKEYFAIPA